MASFSRFSLSSNDSWILRWLNWYLESCMSLQLHRCCCTCRSGTFKLTPWYRDSSLKCLYIELREIFFSTVNRLAMNVVISSWILFGWIKRSWRTGFVDGATAFRRCELRLTRGNKRYDVRVVEPLLKNALDELFSLVLVRSSSNLCQYRLRFILADVTTLRGKIGFKGFKIKNRNHTLDNEIRHFVYTLRI